jgi:hypothetical protein
MSGSVVPSLSFDPVSWIIGWSLTKAVYAGCYWACVADTKEFGECGKRCGGLKF